CQSLPSPSLGRGCSHRRFAAQSGIYPRVTGLRYVLAMVEELGSEPEAPDGVDWRAVRRGYEGSDENLRQLAARYNTTRGQIQKHKVAEGWAPRRVGVRASRQQIINRMFLLVERQIRGMEMKDTTQTSDAEVAVLGKLASTLEKLIEIDNAEPKT